MGTRATGEPGDATAAAPQDQAATIRNEMAASVRSRRAPSGGRSRQRSQRGSLPVFAAHEPVELPRVAAEDRRPRVARQSVSGLPV
jgi:hypothetical protein